MCQSMVNIQSPTAEIRRGKKEEERRKKQDENIMVFRATINSQNFNLGLKLIAIASVSGLSKINAEFNVKVNTF